MDFLRKLILQTRNQLKDLTLSQRLAIGSCAALIVVSLLWLVQWAAEPDLVPLLNQSIASQELGPIQQRLAAMGVAYRVTGDTVMVPADSRSRVLAQLSEGHSLPKDISLGFDKLISETSPWLSAGEQDWRRGVALGNELAKVLREFQGVEDARVFIDKNMRRTVNGPPVIPTASVFVKLRPGMGLDKGRVYAIASLVSRSVSGLDITKVAVTDASTGTSQNVPEPSEMDSDGLEERQKQERYFSDKIRSLLANIPGLLVAVHAELDTEAREERRHTWSKPMMTSEKSETKTQDRGGSPTGPGVVPNTSKAIASGGAADHLEDTSSESKFEIKPESEVVSKTRPNGIKSLSASVNVPRSYLATIYRQANAGKEPTDTDLKPLAAEEIKKITALVRRALAVAADSDAVVVDWFHDESLVPIGEVVQAGSSENVVNLVKVYGGKAGLGALAVVSLFMMLMMVRRVGDGPVLPGEEPPKQVIRIVGGRNRDQGGRSAAGAEAEEEPEALTVGVPPVGEAEAREQLLVGREIDDSTLHVQQVVDQITQLVNEDPHTSVSILRRWIEGEKE